MDLILWRHADAVVVKNESDSDFQRRLTSKGRKQAEHMAEWLERHLPDSAKVLALAGVMGGKESEITDRTRNVFLESAHFQPRPRRSMKAEVPS